MQEIIVLYDYPSILTKDAAWLRTFKPRIEPGSIVILPEDAILVMPPEKIEIKGEPIRFEKNSEIIEETN